MDNFIVQADKLIELIDWVYLIVFVLMSFVMSKAFGSVLQKTTKFTWKKVYNVLIIGALLAIPFVILTESTWVNILVTYTVGTSLYETILGWILGLFKK